MATAGLSCLRDYSGCPSGSLVLVCLSFLRRCVCFLSCVRASPEVGRSCQAAGASAKRRLTTMARVLRCWICALLLHRLALCVPALACARCARDVCCGLAWQCFASLQDKAAACGDVTFPCAGACTEDFTQPCPSGWSVDGSGSCVAPSGYAGQCPAKKSFSDLGASCLCSCLPCACSAQSVRGSPLQALPIEALGRPSVTCRCVPLRVASCWLLC